MTEERITQPDGTGINLHIWPATGTPRAVMLLQHGFNAHGGHMEWPAARLSEAGYACYAVDLRGRGKSDGPRFFVDDFDDYLADLHLAFDRARADHPGLPIFLIGHSAGGVVATSYALRHQAALAGLICHSFAFRVPAPRFVLNLLQWLSGPFPRLGVLKLKNADFSRDPAHVAMMDADPLIANETQPAKTVGEMWKADKRLEVSFGTLTLPVLIIHGTSDHATLPAGSQYFFDRAGSADKTLKLYDGHYHDLLADIGKEAVMADILAWTDARVPAPA
ncbi:lysophospholipase [Sphingomonas suaedae]|uniref:Lysophospholipase n=1 Tax=Sphingomonas suaedae TaxID=2599297 RepID=A0A518REQ7_9SPHN|nr:alpha/beta hydrolase [Sphingomonas suaedae]QDX25935.1 lysophospholipase [Sphingomonas suaedae]